MTTQAQLDLTPQTRTFIGLGEFAGWRFSLTPETNRGTPGFRRETVAPWKGWRESIQRSIDANKHTFYAQTLQADLDAGHPPADWVEEKWLGQWLKAGSIRESHHG